MVPEISLYDPEFEQLLREAASDPDASLLRMPRPAKLRRYFEGENYVGHATPGLTAAERELVRVYRAETAWLLREAAQSLQLNGSAGRRFVLRYHGRGVERKTLPAATIRERASELRSSCGVTDEEVLPALTALLESTGFEAGDERLISTFAALSMKLEPTNRARLIAAKDLINRDQLDSAAQVLRYLLEHSGRTVELVRAWECVGMINGIRREFRSAMHATMQAAGLDGEDANPLMNWFTYAIQSGDVPSAQIASSRLGLMLSPHDRMLEGYVQTISFQRSLGQWSPTTVARAITTEVESSAGPSGRRILSAFQ